LGKALLPKSEPKAITGREKTACARIEKSLELHRYLWLRGMQQHKFHTVGTVATVVTVVTAMSKEVILVDRVSQAELVEYR
jgi:hypothetical protein